MGLPVAVAVVPVVKMVVVVPLWVVVRVSLW